MKTITISTRFEFKMIGYWVNVFLGFINLYAVGFHSHIEMPV